MQLPSGLFCFERTKNTAEPRGESIRYTVIVLLGLAKAEAQGYDHGFDVERISAAVHSRLEAPELRPGDFGLLLWLDARTGGGRGDDLLRKLAAALDRAGGLPARDGMELGWIVTGLAEQAERTGGERPLLTPALAELDRRLEQRTGLVYHHGARTLRRRFPNFATQIYSVHALANVARLGLDDRAAETARKIAGALLPLQVRDGGWPWIYDAARGGVVERYELYSVHQHAMAPMALLELGAVTNDRRYAEAAGAGLAWIHGSNELGLDMADPAAGLIYRSLRRRPPWHRICLYANTAAAAVGTRAPFGRARRVEVNETCRPYELGWLLEAWCGREDALI
jgi:hypothetical protein